MKTSEKMHHPDSEHLHMLLDNIRTQVWYLTGDHTYGMVNRAHAEFNGLEVEDLAYKDMYDIFSKEVAEMWREGNKEAFSSGKTIHTEKLILKPSGEQRLIAITKSPRLRNDGSCEYVICSAEDITERRRAEEALEQKARELETFINNIPHMAFLKDLDSNFILANKAFGDAVGLEPDYLKRHTCAVCFGEEAARKFKEDDRRVIEGKHQITIEETIEDCRGNDVHLETTKSPIFDQTGDVVGTVGICVDITERKRVKEELIRHRDSLEEIVEQRTAELQKDITERKRVEKNLRESENRFRSAVANSPDYIVFIKLDGTIFNVNRLGKGFTEEQVIGNSVFDECFYQNADQCNQAREMVREAQQTGKATSFQSTQTAPDGSQLYLETSVSPFEYDNEGNVESLQLVIRDITERKQSEKEIQRMQRLESLGAVAGGIAHDFNNLLTTVFGNIELAKIDLPDDSSSRSFLQEAHDAFQDARHLTGQLMTFARGGVPVLDKVETASLVRDTVIFNLRGSDVIPKIELEDGLWPIKADKGQIGQVLANLTINARQAMLDGGTLYVNGTNIRTAEKSGSYGLTGEYVRIELRDEGIGIDPNIIERIFDPYFSTKDTGHGLGLAVVHSIINQHNGRINVASMPGAGTTFTVFLPAISGLKSKESEKISRAGEEADATSSLHVLLMDDDGGVRRMGKSMLVRLGHSIDTAVDGDEALEKYRAAKVGDRPFDLVIMDLTIPGGLGGKETIVELLKIDPHARVIVSSGYSTDPVLANFSNFGFSGKLAKPFEIAEVKQEISRVMKKE